MRPGHGVPGCSLPALMSLEQFASMIPFFKGRWSTLKEGSKSGAQANPAGRRTDAPQRPNADAAKLQPTAIAPKGTSADTSTWRRTGSTCCIGLPGDRTLWNSGLCKAQIALLGRFSRLTKGSVRAESEPQTAQRDAIAGRPRRRRQSAAARGRRACSAGPGCPRRRGPRSSASPQRPAPRSRSGSANNSPTPV